MKDGWYYVCRWCNRIEAVTDGVVCPYHEKLMDPSMNKNLQCTPETCPYYEFQDGSKTKQFWGISPEGWEQAKRNHELNHIADASKMVVLTLRNTTVEVDGSNPHVANYGLTQHVGLNKEDIQSAIDGYHHSLQETNQKTVERLKEVFATSDKNPQENFTQGQLDSYATECLEAERKRIHGRLSRVLVEDVGVWPDSEVQKILDKVILGNKK